MKRIFTVILILMLSALMAVSLPVTLTGCAVRIQAEELSADYHRTATDTGAVTEEFVNAMANFSMSLTQKTVAYDCEDGKTNHLVSPLSAMICLSMIACGAREDTLAQMEAVLGMSIQDLNKALYAYTAQLYVGEDCKVSIADSIWYREGESFTVRKEFLQTCADWYAAQQYAAPFDEQTRKDINGWVKKYTDGMIESILEQPIPPEAVMYVINALVFDAKWEEEYEKGDIVSREFTSLDSQKISVEMMHSRESTYLAVEGGQGFAKPYKGGGYSFVGLLPDEGKDVYEFAASFEGSDWVSMWRERMGATVYTRIPEFTYASSMNLTPVLQDMGMTDLFQGSAANLSGIGQSSEGNLFCSGVYQKTYIEVNRNGTKAAAVTWGEVAGNAAPVEPVYIYLDRPFVYAIVDNQTGLPLFVGIVTELS